MRMKLGEEQILLQDDSTKTSDVELKHILFPHVNDRFLYDECDMSDYSTYTDRHLSHLLTN